MSNDRLMSFEQFRASATMTEVVRRQSAYFRENVFQPGALKVIGWVQWPDRAAKLGWPEWPSAK